MPYLGTSPARGLIGTSEIDDSAITTAKIADSAVTSVKTAGLPSGNDIRFLGLEIADIRGVALNFSNGQADHFDTDTLASDTGTTTVYDSTNKWYHNAAFDALVSDNSTTWLSQAHVLGGGATTGLNPESVGLANSDNNQWYKIDFGTLAPSGTTEIVKGEGYYTSPNYDGTRSGAWEYSDNDSSWTSVSTISGTYSSDPMTATWSGAGAHRYWRMRIDSWVGSNVIAISKIRMYRTAVSVGDMTLISNALTASSAPSTGFLTVQIDPVSSVTINTDLKGYISRDSGSNWSEVTLSAGATNSDFTNYEGSVDISGQPSGTAMKYKVTTHNNKELRVSGAVLRWS